MGLCFGCEPFLVCTFLLLSVATLTATRATTAPMATNPHGSWVIEPVDGACTMVCVPVTEMQTLPVAL